MIVKRLIIIIFGCVLPIFLLINVCWYFGLHLSMDKSDYYFGMTSLVAWFRDMPQNLNAKWFSDWFNEISQSFNWFDAGDPLTGFENFFFAPYKWTAAIFKLIFGFFSALFEWVRWIVIGIFGTNYGIKIPDFTPPIL